jgi:DNA-binding CsgD family transcriptional regulator
VEWHLRNVFTKLGIRSRRALSSALPSSESEQEERIARLAREGLSNPEIGERLILSPRTVEWHLKKVFTKLGTRSRMGLVDALRSRDPDAAPALDTRASDQGMHAGEGGSTSSTLR